ncbi:MULTISPECIES: GntR family transcriptional regulator [unclassified Bradyrhizobium]|uniref:GntR family transcriptional regulator n=1 Tax=unclassified Bradyrhizobium TaxID=2631580 RepID=UPI001053DFCD|nr:MULTISPECIES: GntR family transcriptional regulator [unclassified Bradyrhizobium]
MRRYFEQAKELETAKINVRSEARVQPKPEAPKGRKSPKLKRMGLHERAAARMRTMIIRGELPPGSQTQETWLSKELGVSRTPLREAMKVLAAEGLIELRPNRSPRIAGIAADGISELFEALAGIERLAAELAAERATERDLARLRTLQARMEGHHRSGKLDDYFAINGEIHSAIVRMARNTPLREAHETLISRAERARYLALGADRRWSNSVDEHADILAALEARDGEAAGRLLGAHVARTGTALLEVLAASQAKQTAA